MSKVLHSIFCMQTTDSEKSVRSVLICMRFPAKSGRAQNCNQMQHIKILAIVEITKLIIRHIFLKAQVTSKKMNRNKGHNF